MDTPLSLLERLRQPQDQLAWGRFVELYTPLLYSWARQAGLQEADAADLVQEVLTLLFRKLPQFTYDPQQSFRNWLRTVTVNKMREIRRRRTLVTVAADGALDDWPAAGDLAALEEQEYRRQLVGQGLEALRAEFPATMWKAFQEYVVAGRRAEDVARELHVRAGTVYAAKSRILGRLRKELAGLLE